MKILLDEGVPDIIQKRLSSFSIYSVKEMGWRGVKNTVLLDLMAGQFQILITTDKSIPSQQNLEKRQISIVILPTNDVPSVIALLPQIEEALAAILPGAFKQLP
ncbi:MAG: hypothetical protein DMF70_05510 [Acidobacteria bacterium]|nr:MAG: hypothetical protein DMF70_05510 [Acidobacteriota bacterium]